MPRTTIAVPPINRLAPPPLTLSVLPRLGAAAAATLFVFAFWSYAQRASEQAVVAAAQALSQPVSRVVLPRVEILARRDASLNSAPRHGARRI